MNTTCWRESQLNQSKMFVLCSAFPYYSVVSKTWINGLLLLYKCVIYLQNAQSFFCVGKWGLRVSQRDNCKSGLCFSMLSLYRYQKFQGPSKNALYFRKKNKPITRKCFVLQTDEPNILDWILFWNGTRNVVWSMPLRKQCLKTTRRKCAEFLDILGLTKPPNFRWCYTSESLYFLCSLWQYATINLLKSKKHVIPEWTCPAFFCFLIMLQSNLWG